MDEVVLKYSPSKGITNIDEIDSMNTLPKYRRAMRRVITQRISKAYRYNNIKLLCLVGWPLLVLSIIIFIIAFKSLSHFSYAVLLLPVTASVGLLVTYVIFKSARKQNLKRAIRLVKKKTDGCCQLHIHINNRPFEEAEDCCFGVELDSKAFIHLTADLEKSAIQRDKEEAQRRQQAHIRVMMGQRNVGPNQRYSHPQQQIYANRLPVGTNYNPALNKTPNVNTAGTNIVNIQANSPDLHKGPQVFQGLPHQGFNNSPNYQGGLARVYSPNYTAHNNPNVNSNQLAQNPNPIHPANNPYTKKQPQNFPQQRNSFPMTAQEQNTYVQDVAQQRFNRTTSQGTNQGTQGNEDIKYQVPKDQLINLEGKQKF